MNIDTEKLRRDLLDYFGSAISVSNYAIIMVSKIENANSDELISIAINNGFDLNNYLENYHHR